MRELFCVLLVLLIFLYIIRSQAELVEEYRIAEYIKKNNENISLARSFNINIARNKNNVFLFLLIKKL
jgi:hypothetical protein